MHVDEVKQYYEQNTGRFLSFGQGGAEGAIHRAVWGESVQDRRAAFHFVHELVLREARALGPRPLRVLDLGCGVGACLIYLAERLPVQGIGVTVSPLQVKRARSRVAAHAAALQIDFQEANFEHLPSIEAVDLVVAIESFIHCVDSDRFLSQAARILRPGGRLVLCDDFLSGRGGHPTATQRAWLAAFKSGWHVGTLESVAAVNASASRHGLALIRDTDLSPYLELGRLRDRAVAALVRLGHWTRAKNKYLQALAGGDALQRCLRDNLVQYHFIVWTTAKHSAS